MTKKSKKFTVFILSVSAFFLIIFSSEFLIFAQIKIIENGPYLWDEANTWDYIYDSVHELEEKTSNKRSLMRQLLKSENGSIATEGMVLAYCIIDDHQELEEILEPFKNDDNWNYWLSTNEQAREEVLIAHKIKHGFPLTEEEKKFQVLLHTFALIDPDIPFDQWPTYNQPDYGFSLSYPPGWASANIDEPGQGVSSWHGWPEKIHSPSSEFAQSFANFNPKDDGYMLPSGRWMSIEVLDNPKEIAVDSFIKKKALYPGYYFNPHDQEGWLTKTGQKGRFRKEYPGVLAEGDRVDYFVFYLPLKDNSKILAISMASFDKNFAQENKKLLKQLVQEGLNVF